MNLRPIVALLVLLAAPASQQETLVVADEVTCTRCEITVRRLVILGDDRGDGILTDNGTQATRGPDGRYFVTEFGDTSVKVFDANGTFVRLLGRQGQGPGEFQGITAARVDEAGLYVFDLNRRVSLFSAALEFVESHVLPVRPTYNPVLLDDGLTAIAAQQSTRNPAQFPAHLVDLRTAQRRRSLGREGATSSRQYVIASSARRNGLWLVDARMTEKRFELWSTEGEMLVALLGQRDGWFERSVADGAREFAEFEDLPLAHPSVWGLFEDARNYLWTFTAVADPGLKPLVIEGETPLQRRIEGSPDEHRDIVVEVIDVTRGVVVARRRFDEAISPTPGGLVQRTVEDEFGDMRLEILEITLEGGPENR